MERELNCLSLTSLSFSYLQSSFWQSQGEIRFLMLKRFMDVYYASVATAIDTQQTSSWQLPLVTGAAASFYSLIGASRKASQAVNSTSRDLIQHAWYVLHKFVNLEIAKTNISVAVYYLGAWFRYQPLKTLCFKHHDW